MRSRTLTTTAAVLGAVGLALLAYETVEAMRSVVIGTLGTVLLYVGLGLTVIAAALAVASLSASPTPSTPAETPAATALANESAI